MAARGGSIASALLNALNPIPYGCYINYISEDDGVIRKEFENSILSEHYTLDLVYNHRNSRVNSSMLYDIFGEYSHQNADTVRLQMLNEVTTSTANYESYESTAFVSLRMKSLSMDEWLSRQQHKLTRGDEISVYIFSKLYNCHTMVHTKSKPWCTILPTGPAVNYAAACQTHLLYMGKYVFGLLRPKPLPQQHLNIPAIQPLPAIYQQL